MFSFFKRKKNNEALQSDVTAQPDQKIERQESSLDIEQNAGVPETETQNTINQDHNKNSNQTEEIECGHISSVEGETITENENLSINQEQKEAVSIPDEVEKTKKVDKVVLSGTVIEKNSVVHDENTEISNEEKLSWAQKLKQGLSKSRNKLGKSLVSLFGGGKIDEELYEDLEAVLLSSDMGLDATEYLLGQVRERVTLKGLKDATELKTALEEALLELIQPLEVPLVINETQGPFVLMMAGVNGAGKTTSIGKLAKYFQDQNKTILMAAGDTFRAAAREQLIEWGERNNVTVISQAGGDSAAVCFDAVEAAKARNVNIVLADTAGRLPTQLHLMEEIKKVKRVIQKSSETAPHEIILVLDANIGQNAINQVIAFDDALGLTGLILTKLDGTAKGGVVAALAKARPIPVRFIGVGEGIDDLRPFVAKDYVDALLND